MALRIPTLKHRTRRAERSGNGAVLPQRRPDFDVLFDELLATRRRYEELRIAGAPHSDRAEARTQLHLLRAAMASVRAEQS